MLNVIQPRESIQGLAQPISHSLPRSEEPVVHNLHNEVSGVHPNAMPSRPNAIVEPNGTQTQQRRRRERERRDEKRLGQRARDPRHREQVRESAPAQAAEQARERDPEGTLQYISEELGTHRERLAKRWEEEPNRDTAREPSREPSLSSTMDFFHEQGLNQGQAQQRRLDQTPRFGVLPSSGQTHEGGRRDVPMHEQGLRRAAFDQGHPAQNQRARQRAPSHGRRHAQGQTVEGSPSSMAMGPPWPPMARQSEQERIQDTARESTRASTPFPFHHYIQELDSDQEQVNEAIQEPEHGTSQVANARQNPYPTPP